jgi:hypothetical protein
MFHALLENEVAKLGYGTMTVNVIVSNGMPINKTLNIVCSRRKKYG